MTRKICLLPLMLLPLAAPSAAQLVPMGPEFRVDEGVGHRRCPAVAGRGDRGFTVVWGTEQPLHARSYNGAGAPLGGVIDVAAGRLGRHQVNDVTIENRPGQGDLVLWTSSETIRNRFRIENRVVFPALGPASSVQPPRYINSVSPRRTGGFIGTWHGRRGWLASALDSSGRLVGQPVRVSSRPAFGFRALAHAVDGSFAMVWADDAGVRLRRFGADLRPLGAEVEAVPPRRDLSRILLAGGPDGRAAVAWSETDHSDGSLDTYVRFFRPDGTPESGQLLVSTGLLATGVSLLETLAMNSQGRALLVWTGFPAGGSSIPERVSVQLWSPAGAASEVMDLASEPIEASAFPFFCVDAAAAGRAFVVAWLADDAPGSATKAIYARRFFSAD